MIEGVSITASAVHAGSNWRKRACRSGLTIYLADEHGLLALHPGHTLRPDAGALIQAFKSAGLQTTILTGDGSDQADMLARELGSMSW